MGILHCLKTVVQDFIKPLQAGINLSKMHFSDELDKVNNPKGGKFMPAVCSLCYHCYIIKFSISAGKNKATLCLNGVSLQSLSLQEQYQVCQCLFYMFFELKGTNFASTCFFERLILFE